MNNLHSIGLWRVDEGEIIHKYKPSVSLSEDITACLTINEEDGFLSLHKVGNFDVVKRFHEACINRLSAKGLSDETKEWKLVSFNKKHPNFYFIPKDTPFGSHEICTLLNWWESCPGITGSVIFLLSAGEIRNKIRRLQEIGF